MAVGEIHAERARRVFVELHEVPGLVLGTALGEPSACRRVLGARRGGRIGFVLALALLALASPSFPWALWAAALHVALTLLAGLVNRRIATHTTREVQRIALWAVVTPLGVAALVRAVAGPSAWVLCLAVVAGQALLWRALAATRGFAATR